VEAWVSAHHFQMVCPKAVVQEILSEMMPEGWSDQVMGRMVELDDRMDAKGYLRLCTREQTVRLMGNAVSEEVADLARESGLSVEAVSKKEQPGLMDKLVQIGWVRYLLQGVVNRIYKWLN
jgi:hypothetical protein